MKSFNRIEMNYLLRNSIFTLILFSLFLISCGENDDEKLNMERAKMLKEIDDMRVKAYKSLKIVIRSAPIDVNTSVGDLKNLKYPQQITLNKELSSFSSYILARMADDTAKTVSFSAAQTIQIFKSLYELNDKLKDVSEDNYPTFLEQIFKLNKSNRDNYNNLVKTLNWNSSKEHFFTVVALDAIKTLPNSFKIYELNHLHSEKIENNELRPLSEILKAIVYWEQGWLFLADEALSKSIDYVENGNIQIEFPLETEAFQNLKIKTKEDEITLLRSISYGLRGTVRLFIDSKKKNKEAVKDMEQFLANAEKIGMNNELKWLAAIYVGIKSEDSPMAIENLQKLQQSNSLTDKEKALIEQSIAYLKDRKSDKTMNIVFDKLFVLKLTSTYIFSYFNNVNWYKKLSATKAGKQILDVPNKMDEQYQKVKSEMIIF